MSDLENAPPTFQPLDAIQLNSVEDSEIVNVSVYTGRAEITRLFKFTVATGQNQVIINGLPNVLDQDTLRVEGRGHASIHDVTISNIPRATAPTTSPALEAVLDKRDQTLKAQERCQQSLTSLESFLGTLDVQHIAMSQLGNVMDDYESTAEKLDIRFLELKKQLVEIEKEIEAEQAKLVESNFNEKLNLRVAIGLFVESAGEVNIALIYAVHGASWVAGYDIRVTMDTKEEPVTLIYKAGITQSTGEDWVDVPLTLETATPTFGIGVPTLDSWNLSIYKYQPPVYRSKKASFAFGKGGGAPGGSLSRSRGIDSLLEGGGMSHREFSVQSKGNISATFQVPGKISIPSDGVAHNVTIAQLKLNASMSWVCIPKKDTKMHLKAKIKNASEYTLLTGNGSVYVDGSFISKSQVPAVSPGESFDCPLGLDPSIRVTYPPLMKKVSQSGFYTKTSNHVYSQQITLFNTKSVSVEDVKIVDHVPVSEDAQIQVKLANPALSVDTAGDNPKKALAQVKVSQGVVAQWDGADEPEPDLDLETLGKNGKINWLCSVPSQGKISLVLQWEVSAPVNADVVGL